MYSLTILINCVSFKLNMNVLYQRKIIDKCRKTSNFNIGFPKFADRGKPSLGCRQPQMNVFSLWLNFALIAHFCYSFCYSFFPFLAFFKIEETLRKIFRKISKNYVQRFDGLFDRNNVIYNIKLTTSFFSFWNSLIFFSLVFSFRFPK